MTRQILGHVNRSVQRSGDPELRTAAIRRFPRAERTVGGHDGGMSETKKLTRPRNSRMVAGVCQGVADYLGIDATVVRLITVILALVTAGGAVIVYLAAWLLMPEE